VLYQLGPLTIDTKHFEAHEVSRSAEADFASKDVIGALRPMESMGEGSDEITITGTLFPLRFGGLDELGVLDQMRASGDSQILARGDGVNLEWRKVTKVTEKHTFLDSGGVGRVIGYEITAKKCPKPNASDSRGTLLSILA
jgi:phage protein U